MGSTDFSYIDRLIEITERDFLIKDLCLHVGARAPASKLRRQIMPLLRDRDRPITLDFIGIKTPSTSFLDELLGKMLQELGAQDFFNLVKVRNMDDITKQLTDHVLKQRDEASKTL